ncbi:hypothetical protein [Curtobacterium sp. MCBD17_021]|uniref:hypothetical protein n=1 Tax=Curtobacterium sp. MCBD17_021 TaxID=2175665 RepID=UPI0011B7AAD9|nr:hypothetical protein [Curtobacterium sp. MCBD17_021]
MIRPTEQSRRRTLTTTGGVGLVTAALIAGTAVPAMATQPTQKALPVVQEQHVAGNGHVPGSAAAQRGRQVFESLFFLQGGERTRLLLENAAVSTLTDNEIEAVLHQVSTPTSVVKVRQIEKELIESDPEYFTEIGAAVLSGDPVRVQRQLTGAYDEMLRTPTMAQAVKSLEAETTHVPGEVGTDCGVAVVVALGAVIAVTAVAAVNYALAANIALGFNVAAGVNVAYQNNAVRTKSAANAGTSARFSDGIVAAVIEQFGH